MFSLLKKNIPEAYFFQLLRIVNFLFPEESVRRRNLRKIVFFLEMIEAQGMKYFIRRFFLSFIFTLQNKIVKFFYCLPSKSIRKKFLKHIFPVDVIIPIYDAYEDTRKCIESVLAYTATPFQLILINDASKDKRIYEYLTYLSRNSISEIHVIHNHENLGFVRSVNKGLIRSKNDVIILNSDTIVTQNWIGKMHMAAYSSCQIATVTPLSNNASIYSICRSIDETTDINILARHLEDFTSSNNYNPIKIPTAVGFCMFVKREVIKKIGLFNEIYGRGYNEENDFCMRAFRRGYIHVADCSTFVYHKGQASFQDGRDELENKNSKILHAMYPEYPALVSSFKSRILESIRKEMSDTRTEAFPQMKIGISANLLGLNIAWTGCHMYINSLLKEFYNTDEFKYKKRFYSFIHISSQKMYHKLNFLQNRIFARNSQDILLHGPTLDVFHRAYQCYSVYDLFSLFRGRVSVITIHDLISYKNESYFKSVEDHFLYKKLMRLSLLLADRIIAISHHNKIDILNNFDISADKIDVVHHGIDQKYLSVKNRNKDTSIFLKKKFGIHGSYILYVGTDFPHKNLKNLLLAYTALCDKKKINYSLVLAGPSASKQYRNSLKKYTSNAVIFLDYIQEEDMVDLYASASLFVYPSLYEGFGFPILEAMACGVPVVASRATSIPEVVGDAAYIVDCTSVHELSSAINTMLFDETIRNLYRERGFKRIKEFTWEKTARETCQVYDKALQYQKSEKRELDEVLLREIELLLSKECDDPFLKNSIERFIRENCKI